MDLSGSAYQKPNVLNSPSFRKQVYEADYKDVLGKPSFQDRSVHFDTETTHPNGKPISKITMDLKHFAET